MESPATVTVNEREPKPTPSLLEFPGINRNALPEWRKELSERVREKQERRAREAVLEGDGPATVAVDTTPTTAPMLELLRQTELPPLNPIVEAALKRIERAHLEATAFYARRGAIATAVAYDDRQESAEVNETSSASSADLDSDSHVESKPMEKTHNLAVVPNPAPKEEARTVAKKPKRLIGETNDPALNYLDTVPIALPVKRREYAAASNLRRAFAATIDLAIVFALTAPLFALNNLTRVEWQNWRVIAFSAGSFLLVGFLYSTLVTAFTGRTMGMRVCSLRIVDARNGLIPTGAQSAARAFIYLLSVASGGILSLYVFLDAEKNTLQDRFTRTAVIRA
ncbi:MAG: RDD family protein [bacterium]